MYCPEHLVFKSEILWVWLYWRDVPRNRIPARVWLNPLLYEVSVHFPGKGRLFTINREGLWGRKVSYKLGRIRESIRRAIGAKK